MSGSRSSSRSRSTSRSRNRSRSRSLSKSRSSSRSRSTSRSRSRSRSRSSSRSLSKSRNRSRSMSRRAQPLDGVAITELYHRFHKRHKLKWLENQTPYECSGCKEPGHGPRYGCTKSSCNFNLHWDCTFTTFHASHHFYENCQLKFFDHPQESKKGRKCDACLRDIQGFVYHCENGRKYHQCCTGNDLHPTCRNLPPVREITVDDEAVIFRLAKKMKEKCALCGEKHPANGEKYRAKGWSYVSACKTYHLHVACVAHVRNQSAVQRMERKTNLPVVVRNKGGRSSKYWKIIKFAAEFIMSLLSGNPASLAFTLLEPLLQDLLSDMKL